MITVVIFLIVFLGICSFLLLLLDREMQRADERDQLR